MLHLLETSGFFITRKVMQIRFGRHRIRMLHSNCSPMCLKLYFSVENFEFPKTTQRLSLNLGKISHIFVLKCDRARIGQHCRFCCQNRKLPGTHYY